MNGRVFRRKDPKTGQKYETWSIVYDAGRHPVTNARLQKMVGGFPTRAAAQTALRERLKAVETGAPIPNTKLTTAQFLTRWLNEVMKPRLKMTGKTTLARKTFEGYEHVVTKRLIPAFGAIPAAKLHQTDLDAWYAKLVTEDERSSTTVLYYHRVLHHALRWGVKKELLARNIAGKDYADPPAKAEHTVKKPDESRTRALLAAAKGTRLDLPIFLAVATGMRRGEILALAWSAVDLKAGTCRVERSLEQTKEGLAFKSPKNGKTRPLALSPVAVATLKAHRKAQDEARMRIGRTRYRDQGLVVAQVDGTPWPPDLFTKAFLRLVRSAKLPPMRFHDLRHDHAGHLLAQGVDLKVISERLGHSGIGITADLYTHVVEKLDREAAAKMDGVLGPGKRA